MDVLQQFFFLKTIKSTDLMQITLGYFTSQLVSARPPTTLNTQVAGVHTVSERRLSALSDPWFHEVAG
jgi:hypothetical protein